MDAARCLCLVGSDLAELTTVIAKRKELREKLLGLEDEKREFEERYDLLATEKSLVEDQVTSLNR